MRVFEKPNLRNEWKCPVCKKDTEKPVTLIGIAGTEDDGIVECEQFHVHCLDLRWHKDQHVVGFAWR